MKISVKSFSFGAAKVRTHRRQRKGGHLRSSCRRQTGSSQTLAHAVHDLCFEPKYEEFARERSGASQTHSRERSRNSNPSRNSGQRRSWESFWRLDSRRLFEDAWRCRPGRRFFITLSIGWIASSVTCLLHCYGLVLSGRGKAGALPRKRRRPSNSTET
jgi:hypothetical protein